METDAPPWTLGHLAEMFGGELAGPANLPIRRPVPADSDDAQGIAFCESAEYLAAALAAEVGAVIIPPDLDPRTKPAIRVSHPRMAFGMLLTMAKRPLPIRQGIHHAAIVDPESDVSHSASIGAYAVIEKGASIGDGAQIFPFCYVGENCRVGSNSILFPHVVLYQDVIVGENCILHSGAILGADGFGFMWNGKEQVKVPQVGGIDVASDVEIGANTAVDRATAGATSIGHGAKLDNLIQVGHNVAIGEDSVIAAQAAIGGSSKIGDRVTFGGGVMVSDHVTIASDTMFGGSSGIPHDIEDPGAYFGNPPLPAAEGLRAYKLAAKLPELLSRIRALEKRVKELESDQS